MYKHMCRTNILTQFEENKLLFPDSNFNGEELTMMQIECFVTGTGLLRVPRKTVPAFLRYVQIP